MTSLNQNLFQWIYNLGQRPEWLQYLAVFIAQDLPYILVLGFLLLAVYQPGARAKFYVFAEGTLAIILSRGIITTAIHFFYYHARPFAVYGFSPLIAESGSSFPSGHAAWFFALAMAVWYANHKWGVGYFILATFIGIARIYAGIHWPLDIIGGGAIGIASGMFVHWLLKDARVQIAAALAGAMS